MDTASGVCTTNTPQTLQRLTKGHIVNTRKPHLTWPLCGVTVRVGLGIKLHCEGVASSWLLLLKEVGSYTPKVIGGEGGGERGSALTAILCS